MRVIMEYVMNHVHESSPVYQDHPDWFWPYRLLGSDIPWDDPDAHQGWVASFLPDFNYTNVDVARATSLGWAAAWAGNTGVDGFRLGHVKLVDASWLPALHPALSGELDAGRAEDFLLLGDVYSGDSGMLASFLGDTLLDGQTDYPLRAKILEAVLLRTASLADLGTFLTANQDRYDGVMVNTLGDTSHPRMIHFAEDTPLRADAWSAGADRAWSDQPALPIGDSAFQRLAAAFSIVFSLNGIPVILYGDEIGVPGAGDPDNQRGRLARCTTSSAARIVSCGPSAGFSATAACPTCSSSTRRTREASLAAWC
jgi:glycosidase